MHRRFIPSHHIVPAALSIVALASSLAGAQDRPQTREAVRRLPPADTAGPTVPRRGHRPVDAPAARAGAPASAQRIVAPMRASAGRPGGSSDDRDRRRDEKPGSSTCGMDPAQWPHEAGDLGSEIDARFGWHNQTQKYAIRGCDAHGVGYNGTATLSYFGGGMFLVEAKIGNDAVPGIAFRDDAALSVTWWRGNDPPELFSYRVRSDSLEGIWFGQGDSMLGTEYLKPVGSASQSLGGTYQVTGHDPGTNSSRGYTGTVIVSAPQSVRSEGAQPAAFTMHWNISGGTPDDGIALRSSWPGIYGSGGAQYEVLAAATLPSAQQRAETVSVEIIASGHRSGQLVGWWLESIGGRLERGIEIWTRTSPKAW